MQLCAVLFLLTTASTLYMFWALSAPIIRSTKNAPVAATTVFSTPDDGRRKFPKHVGCTCSG